jgi:hypothetical protein
MNLFRAITRLRALDRPGILVLEPMLLRLSSLMRFRCLVLF